MLLWSGDREVCSIDTRGIPLHATDRLRGQVGVETMIVFIAMILVAAIAATMMINAVGSLQSSAQTTSQDSESQVTDQLLVLSATGTIDKSGADARIDRVKLSLMPAPGAGEIDLSGATVDVVGSDGQRTYGYRAVDGDAFDVSVSADPDGTAPVFTSRDDRYAITFNLDENGADTRLKPGESATVRIVGPSGAETTRIISAPRTLSNHDDGDVVGL